MPRYFFHFRHGELTEDRSGEELAGIEAARREAQQVAHELCEAGESPKSSIVVTDGRQLLFEINLQAR